MRQIHGRREDGLDDVLILKLLQQADLANGRARHAFIFRFESDLFERDDVARLDVAGLVDDPVGACWGEGGRYSVRARGRGRTRG